MKSGGVISIEAPELWEQLSGFELFASFTEEERLSFIWALQREAPMCVRRFASGNSSAARANTSLTCVSSCAEPSTYTTMRPTKAPLRSVRFPKLTFLASWAQSAVNHARPT